MSNSKYHINAVDREKRPTQGQTAEVSAPNKTAALEQFREAYPGIPGDWHFVVTRLTPTKEQ